tara:strand:+ start:41 stop:367 length:327 start_codon:yes stop_codon:yes gene_type:complete
MANDFKGVQAVGVTSATTVYTAPANKDSIILELDVSNTTTSAITTSIEVLDSSAGTDAFIVKEAPVPVGGALQVVSGQKVILETGDSIRVTSSGACDIICSVLEDVNS